MSRSGYSDDCENINLWRGAVDRALGGRRGQAFLREMRDAMDALPEKKLIKDDLEKDGSVCAIGAVGRARGVDMSKVDPEDNSGIANVFGLPFSMACEIMYLNDEHEEYDRENKRWIVETDEERFARLRRWVETKIKPAVATDDANRT